MLHTDNCRTASRLAAQCAKQRGSRFVTGIDLLFGLASAQGSASESLLACGVDLDEVRRCVTESRAEDPASKKQLFFIAIQEVEKRNHHRLDGGHILLAMISDRTGDCATLLQSLGADLDDLATEVDRRLPKPTFPLKEAMTKFSDNPRVRQLNEQLDAAQQQVELCVRKMDFTAAAAHRNSKEGFAIELEALLERLWNSAND